LKKNIHQYLDKKPREIQEKFNFDEVIRADDVYLLFYMVFPMKICFFSIWKFYFRSPFKIQLIIIWF